MSDLPFIKFYASDFLGGVSGLSPAERGVYITLLCLIWDKGHPIEEDHGRLARRCGMPKAAFSRCLEALIDERKIIRVDGRLTNERAEKVIVDRENRTEKARGAASARWSAQSEKIERKQCSDDANASLGQCSGDAIPEARSQKPDKKEDTPPPPIEPPAREAPASSGGGGDFQSGEGGDEAETDALLGEVREASGVRVVDVAAGRATVRRWLGLGLGREEIIAQVRARTEKLMAKDPPDPPFALAAFDVSMDQLAAAKAREPKLRPVQVVTTTPEERFEANVATAGRLMEATGSLPDWLKTPEIAAALIERDLATYDQLRRIMRPEDLPRRKA